LLINVSPIYGQFLSTLSAGFLMGLLGNTLQKRDVTIAIILSFMLGLGMLFLHYYVGSAHAATNLLFGDVLGVSAKEIRWMAVAACVTIIILALILRPLVFNSIAPQLAEAKHVPDRLLGVIFMLLMAAAVTLVNQIVGALLVFALLVGPAAISLNLTHSFWKGLLFSVIIAVVLSVCSLILSFYWDLPVSVCLTGLVTLGYFFSLAFSRE
jgi:zinc/manganese transport system permease protein